MVRRWLATAACLGLLASAATAKNRVTVPIPISGMPNQLPYQIPDGRGGQWMIMQQGRISQQGNPGTFAQVAMLQLNGQQMDGGDNGAVADPETGWLVLSPSNVNGVEVVRRVKLLEKGDLLVVDEFTARAGDVETTVKLAHALNFGVVTSVKVSADARKPEPVIGYVAATPQRQTIVHLAGLAGGKTLPQIESRARDNNFETTWKLSLRKGKPAAVVHLYGVRTSVEEATDSLRSTAARDLVSDLPEATRRAVVNLPQGSASLGDLEVLRGEALDVIELHSGDRLAGTIDEKTYTLTGLFGQLTLQPQQVLGMVSVGRQKPRQLLVMRDGQVLGGVLDRPTIAVTLTSGQTLQVPLSSIARIGYRRGVEESEPPKVDTPFVWLRGGDRLAVGMPQAPISMVTRFGRVDVPPAMLHSLSFSGILGDGRQLSLVNGSSMFALPMDAEIGLQLTQSGQMVKLPTAEVAVLQLAAGDLPAPSGGVLKTADGDVLVGGLSGSIDMETEFDVIRLNAAEVRSIARGEKPGSLKVEVWDGTAVAGRLAGSSLTMQLGAGLTVAVPSAVLESYEQPNPMASAGQAEKIRGLVDQLSDDDWRVRDKAQEQLLAMGDSVIPILQSMQPGLPAEAGQRIDAIVSRLEGQDDGEAGNKPGSPPANKPRFFRPRVDE